MGDQQRSLRSSEADIWPRLVDFYMERFVSDKDGTIDTVGLRECLRTKLGPLFNAHADEFESILASLNGTVAATRQGIIALLCEPLQKLRATSDYPDYPTFEFGPRVLNQEQNSFTPLTANRMVSYQMNDGFASIHIQPSFSIEDVSGTMVEGMRALARELEQPSLSYATHVGIDSPLVDKRPDIWQKLGFRIKHDRRHFACATVEEFKRRWLSAGTS